MATRLDLRLVQLGFFPGRERAKKAVLRGEVTVNGQPQTKPSVLVLDTDLIHCATPPEAFVSRGGYKLQRALELFSIPLQGAVCLDIGASTGGFTDCMLQAGAAKVYAVDVGSGQLAPALACNPAVVSLENTNFRYLAAGQLPEQMDFIAGDLSFISLRHILPAAAPFLKPSCAAVFLVKPQFEAGRQGVGKSGVVRDPNTHEAVLRSVTQAALDAGFSVVGLTYSPLAGGDGNREFLLLLRRDVQPKDLLPADAVRETVRAAHQAI